MTTRIFFSQTSNKLYDHGKIGQPPSHKEAESRASCPKLFSTIIPNLLG